MGKQIDTTSATAASSPAGSDAAIGGNASKLHAGEWSGGLKRRTVLDQAIGAAFVFVPIAGTILLAVFWETLSPTAWDVAVALMMYLSAGLGITAGYHRLAAHRSFEASSNAKKCLLLLGSMAFQGPVVSWVADHRRHHAFTDRHGDPHSPLAKNGRLAGLAWSHIGWLFSKWRTPAGRFAPDLVKDPVTMAASRHYLFLSLASLLIPALLGYALRPSMVGFLSGLLLGGCARICLFQNATWAVNSLAHLSGTRAHNTDDWSTNNWFVAILTFGEGWHNNHHAAPQSARHGGQNQLDLTYLLIASLHRTGIAKNVRETKLY